MLGGFGNLMLLFSFSERAAFVCVIAFAVTWLSFALFGIACVLHAACTLPDATVDSIIFGRLSSKHYFAVILFSFFTAANHLPFALCIVGHITNMLFCSSIVCLVIFCYFCLLMRLLILLTHTWV